MKIKVILDFPTCYSVEQALEKVSVIADYIDFVEEYNEKEESASETPNPQGEGNPPTSGVFDLEIRGDTYQVKDELKRRFHAWWSPEKKIWELRNCNEDRENKLRAFLKEKGIVSKLVRINEVKEELPDMPF